MKILNINDIGSSNAMPIKAGTLQFLQDAHKETIAGLITNIIPTPLSNTIYILSGCRNSTVAPIHTLSAGVLYYNGEIFNFDGATFTLTGLQKAYARILTTQYLTNADPVQFTDGVSRNVHNIRKIVIEATTTSSGLPEFKDFVSANNWLKGDVKEVVCDATYLATNFDATGLGRLERLGWAIMNGNNGTPNDNGKVAIAYGTDYTTLGATGGSRDAVVVAHAHGQRTSSTNGNDLPQIKITGTSSPVTGVSGDTSNTGTREQVFTDSAGVSGVDKNMQPYVVRLKIMKLF
jgi:hypothetical protein